MSAALVITNESERDMAKTSSRLTAGTRRARKTAEEIEELQIAAGIAADPDAREITDEEFAELRPASEVVPHIVEAYRRGRGQQKAPTKVQLTVRLDPDVVEHFRSTGSGWQTRINKVLADHVAGRSGRGKKRA